MRRNLRVACQVALALLACTGVAHADRWLVPAGAHATGAQDTNWRTDLHISNPSEEEATVTIYLLEAGQDNSMLDTRADINVPAGGQLVVADVFESKFYFSGTGGLLVESDTDDLVVTSRTHNLTSDGATYGQFIPGVNVDDALGAGVQGHIIYLAKSAVFRSNLGFCAATATGGAVTVTLYDETGAKTGTVSRNFSGFEQFQWNDIFAIAGAAPSTATRAVIVANAPIVGYGSVIDERTGDPVTVMAERYENIAFFNSAIAAAARAEGAKDSLWRTDIRIFNPGDASATVAMDFHTNGRPWVPPENTMVTVGPGAILPLDDAMMEAFGLEEANGGINISSDVAIATWSRTYNQSETGTLGQSIPAQEPGHRLADDEARIYNGLGNDGFRSNVGFFNLGDLEVTLTLTMNDASGTEAGHKDYALRAREKNQVNDVFDWIGVTRKDGRVYSLSIDFEGDVLTYVSMIDNLSNDPVYQPGVIRTVAGEAPPPAENCVDIPLVSPNTELTFEYLEGAHIDGPVTGIITHTWYSMTTTGDHEQWVYDVVLEGSGPVKVAAELIRNGQILDDPDGLFVVDRWQESRVSETHPDDPERNWDTTTTYSPPLMLEPLTRACSGQTWIALSVSATVEGEDEPTQTDTREGEVVSIEEVVTVPAGTFTTVHLKSTVTSGRDIGQETHNWIDVDTGNRVRRQVNRGAHPFGSSDNYIYELVSID